MNKFIAQGKMKQVNATILAPENAGLRVILNAVGQDGKFESALDALLAKRWVKVREDYKSWHATQYNFKMGWLNQTAVSSDTWIVNMLVHDKTGKIDTAALDLAVKKASELAKYEGASLHISNLLVADMPELKNLLVKHATENGVNVYFYAEPAK